MRLFLKFNYQTSEDESCGTIYQRIQNHMLDVYDIRKRWFKFDDSFMNKHRGSSSVIQKFPEMKDFLYFTKREWGNEIFEEPVLSNLDETWFSPNPFQNMGNIPDDCFITILRNIPKLYPFIRTSVAFDLKIADFKDMIPDKENPVYPGYKREFVKHAPLTDSAIMFQSESGEPHRNNSLVFYLRLSSQVHFNESLPELPSSVAASLRGIGRIRSTDVFYIPDEVEAIQMEKKKRAARQLLGEAGQNFLGEMLALKKPHDLPDPFFVLQDSMQQKPNSTRPIPVESIIKLFLGLKGYRYRPKLDSGDSITFGKSTRSHNTINAVFHFGVWSKKLSCMLIVKGLSWEEQIRIPFSGDYHQYPIASEETFKNAVENVSVVIGFLEKLVVPEIEKIYGVSPHWYKAGGEIVNIE